MTETSQDFAYPTPFDWSTPIGRLQYFAICAAVVFPYLMLHLIAFVKLGGTYAPSPAGALAAELIKLLVLLTIQAAAARRLVDLGRSRWWLLAQLIPLLNIYVWGHLFLAKGQSSQEGVE